MTGTSLRTGATSSLDELFHPRSVAIVGASSKGGWPDFTRSFQAMGFAGPVYPVNPRASEIAGLRCYPSLAEIEGEIDYVVSCVPAVAVPEVVRQAVAKRARLLHLFTAGFTETGDSARADLERAVIADAVGAGMRVLGPNCMGLYLPRAGLAFAPGSPTEPGDVAMLSQSGGNAGDFIYRAAQRGLRFSTVISYGNGADLRETELLEYLANDEETRLIAIYMEGIVDGRRFLRTLRRATAKKPVVILKGGRTEAGGRATRSHTGSLAGSSAVFEAACRQAGATTASTMDDLVDLAVAFRWLTPVQGNRVAVVLDGGGAGVLATDELAAAGFSVPLLGEMTTAALAEHVPVAGASRLNPVDVNMVGHSEALAAIMGIVGRSDEVDLIYFHTNFNWWDEAIREGAARQLAADLAEGRDRAGAPIVVTVEPGRDAGTIETQLLFMALCGERGFPVFTTQASAASAAARALRGDGG